MIYLIGLFQCLINFILEIQKLWLLFTQNGILHSLVNLYWNWINMTPLQPNWISSRSNQICIGNWKTMTPVHPNWKNWKLKNYDSCQLRFVLEVKQTLVAQIGILHFLIKIVLDISKIWLLSTQMERIGD